MLGTNRLSSKVVLVPQISLQRLSPRILGFFSSFFVESLFFSLYLLLLRSSAWYESHFHLLLQLVCLVWPETERVNGFVRNLPVQHVHTIWRKHRVKCMCNVEMKSLNDLLFRIAFIWTKCSSYLALAGILNSGREPYVSVFRVWLLLHFLFDDCIGHWINAFVCVCMNWSVYQLLRVCLFL